MDLNASRKPYSNYYTLDNFCLCFLEQRSLATFQWVPIILSRIGFFSCSLRNTLRRFATFFRQICCVCSCKWCPSVFLSQSCLTFWLLLPSSSVWYCICLTKRALQVLFGFRFSYKFFLIILLLIWISWSDSNASNYILIFPAISIAGVTCHYFAGVLNGTAVEFPVCSWVLEKKIAHGLQKDFIFLPLEWNAMLITHFWGKNATLKSGKFGAKSGI